MGLYSKFIFPRLLDWGLGKPDLDQYRREALEHASGDTLEIGFGTGLNLPHYPTTVKNLVAIDSESMLERRVQRRIDEVPFPVQLHYLDAQRRLPFDDSAFDTIITTFVLCSIEEPSLTLAEIQRLLKPGGHYLFFEHGSGLDERVRRWQQRLNPINRLIGRGCNLNRAIDRLVSAGGLTITELVRFPLPGASRLLGELYRGIAIRVRDWRLSEIVWCAKLSETSLRDTPGGAPSDEGSNNTCHRDPAGGHAHRVRPLDSSNNQ